MGLRVETKAYHTDVRSLESHGPVALVNVVLRHSFHGFREEDIKELSAFGAHHLLTPRRDGGRLAHRERVPIGAFEKRDVAGSHQ